MSHGTLNEIFLEISCSGQILCYYNKYSQNMLLYQANPYLAIAWQWANPTHFYLLKRGHTEKFSNWQDKYLLENKFLCMTPPLKGMNEKLSLLFVDIVWYWNLYIVFIWIPAAVPKKLWQYNKWLWRNYSLFADKSW